MTFKDHFSTNNAAYAAHRPTYPLALVEALAEAAPGRRRALDVGCGTGQLSVLLAERFEEVIATDASAAQIAAAEARAGVTYRAAPAQASGLEAGSADLVTVAQAAHWFDLDPFYAEVRRVLRPRGVVALVTYGVIEAEPAIDALVQHFYWTVAGPYWPPERRLVEEGYRSLPFPFAEFALPPLAIEVSWSADDLIGYVGTWSALRQLETTEGRGPLDTFAAELRRNWGAPERRLFRFPLSVRAGRVG